MFEDKSLSTSGGIGSFGRTFANGPVERADNLAVQLPSEDMNIRSETPMPSVADPRLLADFAETAAREPVTFIESRRGPRKLKDDPSAEAAQAAAIPYGRQSVDQVDIDAVVEVLRSDWLTQGPTLERFEQAVAERCQASHAVAVSNATAGLHLACLAAGLGAGDWLWTSPNSFVASANCARYCGAEVDFVDIDPLTWNLDVSALALKLEQARAAGRLPKVLVAVAFSGQSCDMQAISRLAREYGFCVIEDAAHAFGASYAGEPVGCGSHADMTVFSFHPVKIITSGEGGMVLCRDPGLARHLRALRSHGITRDPAGMTEPTHGGWYYQQTELGFNYRMCDVQAALGLSQLRRLDEFLDRRRALAARYQRLLADLPLQLPANQAQAESAWHLYVVRLPAALESSHRAVFEGMRAAGIMVNLHYIPIHLQPYYRALGFAPGDFPEAERYYRQAITLPLYPDLSDAQQDRVVQTLRGLLAAAECRQ
ncbi:MAG: UDP-4-amino-4,6-dideoxy-N-acetyl-beta-L-altrosamine transaminase [Pseudomonas sp.]|uniref:UDP-4-amino-4, 6-dideoxy-N-acetyl-beta-L-altrosamine transaminase n=1 Tax=Pseudomonas sp. TaxID=306 RepID=UPI003D0EA547